MQYAITRSGAGAAAGTGTNGVGAGGGGSTMIVHPEQYCWTIWVMLSSFRQLVVGRIVTLLTGLPSKVVMSTEISVLAELVVQV
jgi:hypothetical protein